MSRSRRKQPQTGFAHYAAPVAFLAFVTIAVLLVHSALGHHAATPPPTTTATTHVRTHAATTTKKPAKRPSAKTFYTVQTGDTFGSIASKERITVEQLQSLNPGVSSNALQVGQQLRVK